MPVYLLSRELIFPQPELAEEDGLLAVGGDLSEERILLAYSMGIFPWYSQGSPILWWSPDPRLVMLPDELKISRSLRQTIRKGIFRVTIDSDFDQVIRSCATVHEREDRSTWITRRMIDAYSRLHRSGHAHSVESWQNGELAGGLYGVSMGKVFFGESMFSKRSDASKVAFALLVHQLREWDYRLIDCQVKTNHLIRLGAREIPRPAFLGMLREALAAPAHHWAKRMELPPFPCRKTQD
jgi:leucyl/phenylalanyl-tRNA---protein transferase